MNRPYQEKALAAIDKTHEEGIRRQLIVMATGTGKTHVFSQIPESRPGQMLIMAHREELIDQAIKKLNSLHPEKRIDKEKAEHVADPSQADIIVASVASLTEKRRLKYNWEKVETIIIDEAHHSTADSYKGILDAAGMFSTPGNRMLLGVTATPQRGDGEPLAQIYEKISYVYTLREAIDDGWLVDVRGYKVRTDTSLDAVKTSAGDFASGSLADVINTPERNSQIFKAWSKLAENRQTIGFCANIQHAQDLAKMFKVNGISAEAVWGNDPLRAEKIAAFSNEDIEVLFNVDVLTEGYDEWKVECVLIGSPTKSPVKYAQRVGRGTRLQPQYGNLKQYLDNKVINIVPEWVKVDCLVIEMADHYTRSNSLVTLPTLMGLPGGVDLQGKSLTWAAKQVEEAQKDFPHVDFANLPDLSNLQQYIEEVSLFDPVFPEETSDSLLSWHRSANGGYSLLLPNKDYIKISHNLLDEFELDGYIKETKYKGVRKSLTEALSVADTLVQKVASDSLRVVKKEMAWHNEPATPAQLKTLKKFYKGKQIPTEMTKGKASRLISVYLAGKK